MEEVPPIELPEHLAQQLQQPQDKPALRPGDLLVQLVGLSEDHYSDTALTERAGHIAPNERIQKLVLRPHSASASAQVRTASSKQNIPLTARAASEVQKNLSPIEAARVATVAKEGSKHGSNRPGHRRKRLANSQPPLPRHCEVQKGWKHLLDEIATSSRRVRLVRGGQMIVRSETTPRSRAGSEHKGGSGTSSPRSPPATAVPTDDMPGTAWVLGSDSKEAQAAAGDDARKESGAGADNDDPEEEDHDSWQSYRIDEQKVPNSVLAALWRQAVETKQDGSYSEVEGLDNVPRLTVTRREVQPLPPVHDIIYWRQANKRQREKRKARRDAERAPTLEEMLTTMFGEHDFLSMTVNEAKLTVRKAAAAKAAALEELGSEAVLANVSALQRQAMAEELQLLQEVEDLLKMDADEIISEAQSIQAQRGSMPVGNLHRGRRGAFDEGRASAKAAGAALTELQHREHKTQVQSARLRKAVEASKALAAAPVDKVHIDDENKLLSKVVASVNATTRRCEARVRRIRESFMRRQGHLSERLQRRVKRIQLDHLEIHDQKERSILPSVVAGQKTEYQMSDKFKAQRTSVLQYLKPHRCVVEKQRKARHAIYLRQTERFEQHFRRLADPNRNPERGEIFVSQCFRHVLAAGLTVDKTFFFRVLLQMAPQDFQKAPTVNAVVACCDAFDIPSSEYMEFLERLGWPQMVPSMCKTQASFYDENSVWEGVELVPYTGQTSADQMLSDQGPRQFCDDELPLFPVLPPDSPRTSELASRNDPLHDIIQNGPLDSVLERYKLLQKDGRGGMKTLIAAVTKLAGEVEENDSQDNDFGRMDQGFRVDPRNDGEEIGIDAPQQAASVSAGTETSPARDAGGPARPPLHSASPPISRRVPRANATLRGNRPYMPTGHPTLKVTRGLADPMSQLARSPRSPAKQERAKPSLRTVNEMSDTS
eukprot:TRINITY_DN23086_c0_g1_i1.p1 TRINITY_DN23086_c0_g1~~TRINITY_DN23086_c0_g1_i1.p1  ORF type:complete len:941 (-),score=175.45 TRINITY_DN23086_c0_g1_i1:101-2923(-)